MEFCAQCQQLHHGTAGPVPVCAAPPPDNKQPCIEAFVLSSARVPVLLPACSANWDAERFNDAQGTQDPDPRIEKKTSLGLGPKQNEQAWCKKTPQPLIFSDHHVTARGRHAGRG